MITTDEATLSLYWPLWGATFDSDEVGGIGRGVTVCVPLADEWRTVQQTDVWMAQWRSEGGGIGGPQPPCCLVLFAGVHGVRSIHEAIVQKGSALQEAARTAVTALRLHRPGWFLEPTQALTVYYAPSLAVGGLAPVVRAPGPYRQIFVSGDTHRPAMPYALRLADLTVDPHQPGPIAHVWALLQAYQWAGRNTSVDIAIEAFHQSYGFQLRPASRVGNLFTALDAMLGGMSAWKVAGVPVKPRGYARRAEAALRTSRSPAPVDDPVSTARWLHHDRGGRGLRNGLAHGNAAVLDGEVATAHERLQAIVRAVLWQYLELAVAWARNPDACAAQLALRTETPLAAVYVTALEAEARRPGILEALLRDPV
jgi:hypothetical protein